MLCTDAVLTILFIISSAHAKRVLSMRPLGMEGVDAPAEGSVDVLSEALGGRCSVLEELRQGLFDGDSQGGAAQVPVLSTVLLKDSP